MRVVALCSGGKDSCYSMQLCKQHGHDVVALANLLPEETAPDELDSFCFQTVGHQLVGEYAACMGVPLFRKRISGTSSVQDLGYSPTDGDEVEDLFQLLAFVKESIPGIQAVASGAIASDYQRLRVENVCSRLNLVSLAYLWHQPQRMLLRGMIESGIEAILVKVACLGLSPRKHLGRTIAAMEPHLMALADAYGCNVCGEGGEYETLTLDCPLFSRGYIVLDEYEVVHGSGDVGYLVPKAFRVLPKSGWEGSDLPADIRLVPADYVAAPRFSRCSAPTPPSPPSGTASAAAATSPAPSAPAMPPVAPIAAAAGGAGSGGSTVATAASASGLDALLLQPAAPSAFNVQVSMCSGPDYVQLACKATRTRSALLSDVTECDTTAALHALLTTAQQELAAHYMDLHHCLFVHLFLANMGHFQAANGVYCKYFPSRDPPSRACVQVCLPHDCPVMCEFLLARGSSAPSLRSPVLSPSAITVTRHTRRVLHVQSISSWAPSCIGPYSQATSYRGLVYLAGVIPLDPPVMTLVPGDITAQVLRAMTSCEAVAVAQRTTVVGAALGLTVYLAAAVGGVTGGGGGCGACACGVERSGGSGTSAELRALTRAAVEALLDHGLPGHPFTQYRPGGGAPTSASRYHRSSTSESAYLATPRGSTTPGMIFLPAANGISAPGSRRAVILGADGLDEEEEERAAAEAVLLGRVTVSGGVGLPSGGGALAAAMAASGGATLDPYLQPPEVRSPVRPSVLYVTVPALPRGSLVEIQPVCLDVEALAVIRRLTGHESFVKRRNSSHHDATLLHQQALQHQHQPLSSNGGHAPAQAGGYGPAAFPVSPFPSGHATTTWSDLPRTPRGSMESVSSGGAAGAAINTSGGGGGSGMGGRCLSNLGYMAQLSALAPWLPSGEQLQLPLPLPLPSHMLSPAGFMSPEAGGSLAGTPSAGPSILSRQRSSGLGLLGAAGNGSGVFNRCNSPGLGVGGANGSGGNGQPGHVAGTGAAAGTGGGWHGLHIHPPPSAHASGHQLLSPTLQNLLNEQLPQTPSPDAPGTAQGLLPPHLRQQSSQLPTVSSDSSGGTGSSSSAGAPAPPATQSPTPPLRQRMASIGGGGAGGTRSDIMPPSAATAAGAGSMAGLLARTSYSGSSGSSGPLLQRSSLDGNILSFEVSSGRAVSSYGLSSTSPLPPHAYQTLPGLAMSPAAAAMGISGGGSGIGPNLMQLQLGNGSSGGANGFTYPGGRLRPAAISVPQSSIGATPIQASPFESMGPQGAAMEVYQATVNAMAAAVANAELGAAPLPPPPQLPPQPPPQQHRIAGTTPPARVPFGLTTAAPTASSLHSTPAPGGSQAAAGAGPGGPAATVEPSPAPPAVGTATAGGASGTGGSSDVMVTTVCCYGQVLRSLFHLPPAVFAPGVTTAQLTRRFRRAAASVLAAHGMDMSCLIWVRVWYEKGAVGTLVDDEYGCSQEHSPAAGAAPAASTSLSGQAGAGSAFGGTGGGCSAKVLHALDDEDEVAGSCRSKRGSGSDDSSNGGGRGPAAAAAAAAAAARALGSGEYGGCASPRPSPHAGKVAVGAAGGSSPGVIPTVVAAAIAGCDSPARPASPALPGSLASGPPDAALGSPIGPRPPGADGLQAQPALQTEQSGQHHHRSHHTHHHNHHQHHTHQHHGHHQSHQPYQQTSPGHGHHQHGHQQHQQPFHVAWVPVQKVATNANPQPRACVGVLELLAALPSP